jgi:radical SAM protein with 4Fe4S-binding SPASM domain
MSLHVESKKMVAEDIADITSGIRSDGERVAYLYAEVEKRHRLRFLFDPLRLLRDKENLDRYRRGENPFPTSVEIDPSNGCNHDCSFCIYHSMHGPGRSERLSDERLMRLIDELHELGTRSILFVGGGEPMTHTRTADAIERAAGYGISCGLVTNGSLVMGERAKKLKQHATYVRFSFDAASAETHLLLHRKDDFDQIVANLFELSALDGPCTVGTGFFINEQNVHEVYACAELVKRSGADYIQLKSYSGIAIPDEWYGEMLDEVEKTLSLSDETFDVHVMDRLFHRQTFQVRGYTRCHMQALKTVINADGSVYLCAQKRTNPDGRIGNINDMPLAEVWNGEQRRQKVATLDLVKCPFCVHDQHNKMVEFLTSFEAPHGAFF